MQRAIHDLVKARTKKPKALVTLDDAVAYAAWIAERFALGRLDVEQVKAADKLLDRFATLVQARDREGQIAALLKLKEGKS